MKTKFQKFIAAILAVLMIISVFPITSYAKVDTSDVGLFREDIEDVDVNHPFKYGHEIHYTTVNGKSYPLFCINRGKASPSKAKIKKMKKNYSPTEKVKEAAKWIYAGYYLEHGDNIDFLDMAYCQKKVWNVLGDAYDDLAEGFTFSNKGYRAWVDKARKNMKQLNTQPSFNKKAIKLKPGETKRVVEDTNGVLKDYPAFTKKGNGITISHKKGSNKLVVEAVPNCGKTSFKIKNEDKIYKETTNHGDQIMLLAPISGGNQNLVYSAYFDPVNFTVNVTTDSVPTPVSGTKVDAEKTHAQGDATLEGATYGLYCDGNLLNSGTTDSDGEFELGSFTPKKDSSYYVQEISPSEGYLLSYNQYTIPVNKDKDGNLSVKDISITAEEQVIKGSISIIKHSDDGSTQIETPEVGAEFEVYLTSAGSYEDADPDERDTIVCDSHGFAQTKPLPYGTYTVHQTKGWEGREYMRDFDVFISSNGEVYRYLINNAEFMAYLKVVKRDKETEQMIPLKGAGFEIYDSDGNKVEMTYTYPQITKISTFYTADDGSLMTPEKLHYGDYTLVEVQAPYGYVLDSTPIPFSVKQDYASSESGLLTIEVNAFDMPQKGTINLTKTGEVLSSVTESQDASERTEYTPVYETRNLKGATYEIFAAEDITTPDNTVRYEKGAKVDTITTNDDGFAKSKELYLGKYTVVEKTAPNGYVLDKKKYDVTLTYAGQDIAVTSTAQTTYNERQKVRMSLHKAMEQNGIYNIGKHNEIANVKFGIFADEKVVAADGTSVPKDGMITSAYCDYNGNITFDCDLPIGYDWYAKEIETDVHYILSDVHYKFDTDYAGQDIDLREIPINNGESIYNSLKKGRVQGLKVGTNAQRLEGAVFGIFEEYECDFSQESALTTTVSDHFGNFSFDNVPYGNWIVKELIAPKGFALDSTLHRVNIPEDATIIELTVKNKQVEVLKVDIATGKELPGAKMRVTDIDGNIIDSWTSTNKPHIVNNLMEGQQYILTEITAPYGYEIAEDIIFVVSSDKETQKIKMEDDFIRTTVRVFKRDKSSHEIIKSKGFEFGIYKDKDCKKLIEKKKGNKKTGTVTFKDLRYGTYYIKETKAPKGYLLSDHVVEVIINDKGVFANGKELSSDEDAAYVFNYYDKLIPVVETGDIVKAGPIIGTAAGAALGALGLILIIKKLKKKED